MVFNLLTLAYRGRMVVLKFMAIPGGGGVVVANLLMLSGGQVVVKNFMVLADRGRVGG